MHGKVVVIGAGLSGLATAARLSQQGIRVQLFERRSTTGGYVHTFNRGKYCFEASTHQMAGCRIPGYGMKVFDMLGINGLPLKKSSRLCEVIAFDPANGNMADRFVLPAGFEAIHQSLTDHFPASKEEIGRFAAMVRSVGEHAVKLRNISREPGKFSIDALLALMLRDGKGIFKALGKWRYRSVVRYANSRYIDAVSFISDEKIRWLLSVYTCYLGTDPQSLNALIMIMLNYLYLQDGPYLVDGGTGVLIRKLEEVITGNGGTIERDSGIKQICINQNKAVGVYTEDGTYHPAEMIVSAINTFDTFTKFLSPEHVPTEYLKAIREVGNSCSTFQIYLGLKRNPREFGFEAPTTFFDASTDVSERFSMLMNATTPESRSATSFLFSNYAEDGISFSPPGTACVSIAEGMALGDWSSLSPEAYRIKKAATTEVILQKVEKVTGIPIGQLAEVVVSASPKTMFDYSQAPGGAMVGAAYSSDQVLFRRTQQHTPIKNLFLAGAFSGFGGVMGSMDSGITASNLVLKAL